MLSLLRDVASHEGNFCGLKKKTLLEWTPFPAVESTFALRFEESCLFWRTLRRSAANDAGRTRAPRGAASLGLGRRLPGDARVNRYAGPTADPGRTLVAVSSSYPFLLQQTQLGWISVYTQQSAVCSGYIYRRASHYSVQNCSTRGAGRVNAACRRLGSPFRVEGKS
jgi:hypothetical protein